MAETNGRKCLLGWTPCKPEATRKKLLLAQNLSDFPNKGG